MNQTILLKSPPEDIPVDFATAPKRVATTTDVAPPAVRFTIHHDLSALEQKWRAFAETADGTAFQTYEWLTTWQQYVGQRQGVHPIVVIGTDSKNELLFLLPLAIERLGPARCLTWLGSDLCDYNAPLLAPDFSRCVGAVAFAQLWHHILEEIRRRPELRFDLVRLEKMPEVVGRQSNPFRGLAVSENPSHAYQARLGSDWDAFYAEKRSSNTRRRDRAKRKKLSEMGEVRFVTPESPEEVTRSLQTLIHQKTLALTRMGAANFFARPGWSDFFCAIAASPQARQLVHVSRLDVGAIWAAINLGLLHRGCYYHVLASYDAGETSRFGAGAAHLHDLMRYAIDRGCDVFDFTIGDEPYKRDWCDVELTLYDHLNAWSALGRIMVAWLATKRTIKRTIKRTPLLWNAAMKVRSFASSLRRR